MPAATWTATAVPVSARQAVEGGYVELGDLRHITKLAKATIRDALSRPPIEDVTVPLGALARPAARIGGVASPEPLWSREQVDEYLRRREVQNSRVTQRNPDLPQVSATEARERNLASVEELAEELGLAPNTLRRWARTYRTVTADRPAFPPEVAMARREPPNHRGRQHRLRDRQAVAEWVLLHTRSGADDLVAAS